MRRGCDPAVFEYVVNELANERQLAEKYRDHPLSGNYIGFRECHLAPDWLLIYVIDKGQLVLTLSRTGTHSISARRTGGCAPFTRTYSEKNDAGRTNVVRLCVVLNYWIL